MEIPYKNYLLDVYVHLPSLSCHIQGWDQTFDELQQEHGLAQKVYEEVLFEYFAKRRFHIICRIEVYCLGNEVFVGVLFYRGPICIIYPTVKKTVEYLKTAGGALGEHLIEVMEMRGLQSDVIWRIYILAGYIKVYRVLHVARVDEVSLDEFVKLMREEGKRLAKYINDLAKRFGGWRWVVQMSPKSERCGISYAVLFPEKLPGDYRGHIPAKFAIVKSEDVGLEEVRFKDLSVMITFDVLEKFFDMNPYDILSICLR